MSQSQSTLLIQMDPYNPDTEQWSVYTERLEQFFKANSIADEKKTAVFLTAIGTKTYTLLRNLIAPAKSSQKNYDHLVATLKAHLEPKPLTIAERFKFHKRNQLEGETIAQYLAELRRLVTFISTWNKPFATVWCVAFEARRFRKDYLQWKILP